MKPNIYDECDTLDELSRDIMWAAFDTYDDPALVSQLLLRAAEQLRHAERAISRIAREAEYDAKRGGRRAARGNQRDARGRFVSRESVERDRWASDAELERDARMAGWR